MRTAAQISNGERVTINSIDFSNPYSGRLLELGFTPGQNIMLVNKSLFSEPYAFAVRGTMIALRKKEAEIIKVL